MPANFRPLRYAQHASRALLPPIDSMSVEKTHSGDKGALLSAAHPCTQLIPFAVRIDRCGSLSSQASVRKILAPPSRYYHIALEAHSNDRRTINACDGHGLLSVSSRAYGADPDHSTSSDPTRYLLGSTVGFSWSPVGH
jgi:hypothetical protein